MLSQNSRWKTKTWSAKTWATWSSSTPTATFNKSTSSNWKINSWRKLLSTRSSNWSKKMFYSKLIMMILWENIISPRARRTVNRRASNSSANKLSNIKPFPLPRSRDCAHFTCWSTACLFLSLFLYSYSCGGLLYFWGDVQRCARWKVSGLNPCFEKKERRANLLFFIRNYLGLMSSKSPGRIRSLMHQMSYLKSKSLNAWLPRNNM